MFYAGKVRHYGITLKDGRHVEDEAISSAQVVAFPKKAQRELFLKNHPDCEVVPSKLARWVRDNEWKSRTLGYSTSLSYYDATIPEYWEGDEYEQMAALGLFDQQ